MISQCIRDLRRACKARNRARARGPHALTADRGDAAPQLCHRHTGASGSTADASYAVRPSAPAALSAGGAWDLAAGAPESRTLCASGRFSRHELEQSPHFDGSRLVAMYDNRRTCSTATWRRLPLVTIARFDGQAARGSRRPDRRAGRGACPGSRAGAAVPPRDLVEGDRAPQRERAAPARRRRALGEAAGYIAHGAHRPHAAGEQLLADEQRVVAQRLGQGVGTFVSVPASSFATRRARGGAVDDRDARVEAVEDLVQRIGRWSCGRSSM